MNTLSTKLAARLDASPRIIWNWRVWPKMLSVRLAGLGATFNIVVAAMAIAVPTAAPLYVIYGTAAFLIFGAVIFILAALGRLFVQPNVSEPPLPPASPPSPPFVLTAPEGKGT